MIICSMHAQSRSLVCMLTLRYEYFDLFKNLGANILLANYSEEERRLPAVAYLQ
jgi:hypothetical protein